MSFFLLESPAPAVLATVQWHARFRNDDGSETTATYLAAEDANATLTNGSALRVRLQLDTSGDIESKRIGLGYKVNSGQLREAHS